MHNGGSWKEGSRCARGQIGARGRGQVGWGCCGGGRRPAWQKVAWSVVHAGAILHGENFATFDLEEGTQKKKHGLFNYLQPAGLPQP